LPALRVERACPDDETRRVLKRLLPAILVLLLGAAASEALADDRPRIRRIWIDNQGVFTPDEKLDDVPLLPDMTWVFDVANFIHIDTREHVVRRELLFREGEPLDPERLAESERNLRQVPFLRQVRIFTKPVAPKLVDVVVRVQDTWTTDFRLSFSSGGGDQKTEFGFLESNLFGFGKRLVLLYSDELDRTSKQIGYDDPRVLGTRWRWAGNYEDKSDGREIATLVEYPFYSLDTPWAGSFRYSSLEERLRIYETGEGEVARFDHEQELLEFRLGKLFEHRHDELVQRGGFFYRWLEDAFPGDAVGPEAAREPPLRRESAPGLFYDRQEIDFRKERFFNSFDRIEDLNLGNVFRAELAYSGRGIGARDDEPILFALDRQGFDFGPGHKAFLFGLVSSRYREGYVRNAVFELEAVSYNRFELPYVTTLVTRLKLDLGKNFDPDNQLFLGNDNGLRGFPNREFVGVRRFIFNVENRVFFVNDLFHLVSLGMVVFFDSGYVWDRGQKIEPGDVVASAGIGFRIGVPRSAGEKVWRFDLAIPLTVNGDRQFEPAFSFGSGQAFIPFVGPFDLQTTSGD
jgi:hypothetical protein